jgi:hypothetical protein
MSNPTFVLPVSVEQVAVVIRQMGKTERRQLLNLVPELNGKTRRLRVKQPSSRRPRYAFARVRALLRDVPASLSTHVSADRADRV